MLYVFQINQGVEKYAGAVHRIAAGLAGSAGKTGSHPKGFLRLCRKLAGRLQIPPADEKLNRPAIMIRAGAGLALCRKKFPSHHRLPMRAAPLPGLAAGSEMRFGEIRGTAVKAGEDQGESAGSQFSSSQRAYSSGSIFPAARSTVMRTASGSGAEKENPLVSKKERRRENPTVCFRREKDDF